MRKTKASAVRMRSGISLGCPTAIISRLESVRMRSFRLEACPRDLVLECSKEERKEGKEDGSMWIHPSDTQPPPQKDENGLVFL